MTSLNAYLDRTIAVLHATRTAGLDAAMERTVDAIAAALRQGRPLLVCGNGGSASDAMHIAGELVGRFRRERRGLNAIALSANPAVLTAWANDYDYDTVFSRQVEAHGCAGGVLLGISTSGNSRNVVAALHTARAMGMTTIGLTGQGGGAMAELCDVLLDVPSRETPHIQEVHICLYHLLCDRVEAALAG
ncbi:D-sedoheptulose-7-phosphate isomerase [Azospirillum halopraeferens]|uniref:D-sedoheptulose-7-phosphate isomerase n=1 Tax=Azospirillum halopraeferens TaxID=34010 RepID=UPI00040F165F|nr:SIS domain-containing protein [Azospirillum halopraeferens]